MIESVPTYLGPVPVRYVPDLTGDKGEVLFGYWNPFAREILIRANMDPQAQVQAIWHEWIHSVLHDSGISLPDEETVCDSVGTALAVFGAFL